MGSDRTGRKGQLHRGRGESGNAGFSLVELLIAVTILAIIVIPLLHMFVTSTRINVKSRQTLRATTVAQDIMEGLKAYTLEEVRTQFSLPDGSASSAYFTPTEGFYVLNSSMIQGGVREITELEKDRDAGGDPVNPSDPDNEIYYFGIENLKMQGGEYDALIKLDASTYTASKAGESGRHNNVFNGKFYADVMSVSETGNGSSETDSSFHEPAGLAEDVIKDVKKQVEDDFASSNTRFPANWDDEWEKMKIEDIVTKREILVEIGYVTDGMSDVKCQARTTFTYSCKCPTSLAGTAEKSIKDAYGNEIGREAISDIPYTSYGSAGGSGEIKGILRTFSSGNFYLLYYPIYKTGETVDNLTFTVKDGDKLFNGETPLLKSITLVKQIRSDVDESNNIIIPDMSDDKLYYAEQGYMAQLSVIVDHKPERENLIFRTNLDTNISRKAWENDDEDDNMLDSTKIRKSYDLSIIDDVVLAGDEVSGKATNVIYDIEITVFKTGAADEFKNLPKGGTTAQFEQYYRDHGMHKLATITNGDWN